VFGSRGRFSVDSPKGSRKKFTIEHAGERLGLCLDDARRGGRGTNGGEGTGGTEGRHSKKIRAIQYVSHVEGKWKRQMSFLGVL